jgi:hypothetical protein
MDLPAIHVFHTEHNIPRIVLKCTVECNDVRRAAIMPDLEFPHNLLADVLFCINSDDLFKQILARESL